MRKRYGCEFASGKVSGSRRRNSVDELRQAGVSDQRNRALAEIIIVQTEDPGVGSEAEFVRAYRPSQVVVDEEARGAPALHPRIVQPSQRREGSVRAAALQHDWKRRQRFLKVGRPEQTFIPGERGIEIVHQMCGKHVRIAGGEGIEGLRRDGVKDRIDGIGVGSLEPGVGLKAEPRHVVGVDVVVDAGRLHLLAIVARMRNALAVRASVSIRWIAARRGPIAIERAPEYRERRAGGIAIQRKKLPVERHQLRRGLIASIR